MSLDGFFTNLFSRTPGWFFVCASIIILIALAGAAYWIVLSAKKFSDSLGKESTLIELKDKVNQLNREKEYHENVSSKLLTVIENTRLFLNSINENRGQLANYSYVIQRIVETLAYDVKTKSGEKHRCGFWIPDHNNQELRLINGSSGFPDHYIQSRKLGFDESIAGRSFRKLELINCEDVYKDADYSPSNSGYKSLICVPVNEVGVLTIDGISPFDKSAESIAELYGTMIESVFVEMYIREFTSSDEAAYTRDDDDREGNEDEYN